MKECLVKSGRRSGLFLFVAVLFLTATVAGAQQTLGGLNGTVTDSTGAVIGGANVSLTGDANGISLTTTSQKSGFYQFRNLPVGAYTLQFTHDGFDAIRVPSIPVQENRTGTINAILKAGSTTTTVEVRETPLLNE